MGLVHRGRWPRSREVVDMTAFCSTLEEVFNGRPRAACNKTNNRDFAKKLKERNYHTLLNLEQLAACDFTHWWWSNGQKKFIALVLRGFARTFSPRLLHRDCTQNK